MWLQYSNANKTVLSQIVIPFIYRIKYWVLTVTLKIWNPSLERDQAEMKSAVARVTKKLPASIMQCHIDRHQEYKAFWPGKLCRMCRVSLSVTPLNLISFSWTGVMLSSNCNCLESHFPLLQMAGHFYAENWKDNWLKSQRICLWRWDYFQLTCQTPWVGLCPYFPLRALPWCNFGA